MTFFFFLFLLFLCFPQPLLLSQASQFLLSCFPVSLSSVSFRVPTQLISSAFVWVLSLFICLLSFVCFLTKRLLRRNPRKTSKSTCKWVSLRLKIPAKMETKRKFCYLIHRVFFETGVFIKTFFLSSTSCNVVHIASASLIDHFLLLHVQIYSLSKVNSMFFHNHASLGNYQPSFFLFFFLLSYLFIVDLNYYICHNSVYIYHDGK